jgi:hypothetical protein
LSRLARPLTRRKLHSCEGFLVFVLAVFWLAGRTSSHSRNRRIAVWGSAQDMFAYHGS